MGAVGKRVKLGNVFDRGGTIDPLAMHPWPEGRVLHETKETERRYLFIKVHFGRVHTIVTRSMRRDGASGR